MATGATLSKAKGSSGPDVAEWQQLLTAAGFATPITSSFDDATDAQTRAWQKSKGLLVDGIVGGDSWKAMTGKAATGKTDKNAAFGREVLLKVWPKVTGEQPNLSELQISGGQARLESNYGKAPYKLLDHATSTPTNPVVLDSSSNLNGGQGMNNWGAVQTSEGPPGGFLATDTSPTKKTDDNPFGYYDHHYKVYATPEEGAEHFVKHMTVLRPTSWALMKAGDIDAWAQQMWAGKLPNGQLNRDPLPPVGAPAIDANGNPTKGTLGYFEQAPSSRAKGIESHVADIAFTLGEPVMAKRGGPVEAGGGGGEGGGGPGDGGGGGGEGGPGEIPGLGTGTTSVARGGLIAAILAALGYGAYRIWGKRWGLP